MPAAALAGIAIVGGAYGARQAKKGAAAQAASYDAATAEQARQFDVLQDKQRPYEQVGAGALNQLAALYGLPQYSADMAAKPLTFDEWVEQNGGPPLGVGGSPLNRAMGNALQNSRLQQQYQQYVDGWKPPEMTGQPGQPGMDFSSFFASPDYQFALKQGEQTVQNSAAAQGGLYSGNALRALTEFGQGSASQYLNNYGNRLAGIAGVGQTAANVVGQGAMQTGANMGNLMVGAGNTRASGIINQGNAVTGLGNQLAMLYGMGAFGGATNGWGGPTAPMTYNWSGPRYGGFA